MDDVSLGESSDLPEQLVAVESEREMEAHDLSAWRLLHPKGISGMELFNHILAFCCWVYAKTQHLHKISDHNRIVSPSKGGWKKHQKDLSRVDYHHVVETTIMDDLDNGVSLRQTAQARFNNLGQVKSHACFVNSPGQLGRIKEIMS